MEWEFNDETPIYLQIMEQIKAQIAADIWKPGDKLPSVRDLAIEAQVNPNTMQKALTELERAGLLYSQRTAGRFVSDSIEGRSILKNELVENYLKNFLQNMSKIGYTREETITLLQEYIEKLK